MDRNFRKFWLNGSRPQCPVSKILQRYIKELKLTVPFVMWYCFRAPTKTSFFDACQMSVKSCVLHLFPVPQTGRSHIINILLASFFSVRTVNYGSSFFSIDLWRLGHKSMEKNSVRNLQYGPKTRLIRGINPLLCRNLWQTNPKRNLIEQ